jgi:hypothetical protein
LDNQSQTASSIYWNWTNPNDSDFAENIVYIDGSNVANTSDNFYNAGGLDANTSYTITVHTKDTSGNINDTDMNSTAKTNPPESGWETAFSDDFNRANSGSVGGDWTETGGNWDINGNRAHADNCDSPGDWITSDVIDMSSYSEGNISFDWEYEEFENNECLSLDLNDGSGWVTEAWEECSDGSPEEDDGSVNLDLEEHISLTANVQIRFFCISSHNGDEGYIDNVNVSGYG